jgi:hypothetical protein
VVADNKASVLFFNRPGRREAATSRQLSIRFNPSAVKLNLLSLIRFS